MISIPEDELGEAARAAISGNPGSEPVLRELCKRFPGDVRSHFFLGVLLERIGRDDDALHALECALDIDADHVQALSAKTAVLVRVGRIQDAHLLLATAVGRQPENSQLRANLGAVHEAEGDFESALSAYDRALSLPDPPLGAYMNRGYVLTRLGRLDLALENNRALVNLHPQEPDAHFNVAEVLLALRRPAEALASCKSVLQIAPGHSKASIVSGLALAQLGHFEVARATFDFVRRHDSEAIGSFINVFESGPSDDPDRFDPELIYLSSAYQKLHDCDWSERDALIGRFQGIVCDRIESKRGLTDPGVAYNSLTLPLQDSLPLDIARAIADRLASMAGPVPIPLRQGPADRLRIGYISPDFREHLNAYLMRPLVELHDRSRFEVTCYSTGPSDMSDIRERVRQASDKFVDVAKLDDAGIAAAIQADGINILIDAGGYTTYSRPGVLIRRPAPIQVGYLAYPGTQGMDAVSYRIVDRIASPPEQKASWTEALIYLPDTFFIYDKIEMLLPVTVSRDEYGLPADAFVFCSFNNYYKIEPEIFGIWMDILHKVPSSVLWLAGRNATASANLCKEAELRGVSAERLIFAPFESRERYRARFRLADLFLDTTIFNAMTTACDALAAGLPLLTVPGRSFPSRVASSLLTAGGFADGIVQSLDAYRDQAIEWGRKPEDLLRLRREKLSNPLASPLFDTGGRVRQLEMAYEEMWRRHRLGLPPESFNVAVRGTPDWSNCWH